MRAKNTDLFAEIKKMGLEKAVGLWYNEKSDREEYIRRFVRSIGG